MRRQQLSRREFIQTSVGAAGATLAAGSLAPDDPSLVDTARDTAPPRERVGSNSPLRIVVDDGVASLLLIADILPHLRKVLTQHGYHLREAEDTTTSPIQLILAEARGAEMSPERFTWEPALHGSPGGTLSAPTPLSLQAGIAWLADRVACTSRVPLARQDPVRAFARFFAPLDLPKISSEKGDTQSLAENLENFRQSALRLARQGATDLVMSDFNLVVDWGSDWRKMAQAYREYYARAIAIAHTLRLRLLLYGDEFIYQPAWFAARGARLSTADLKFWEVLADKHREIQRALPAADGIVTRTGEIYPWPGVAAFDIMHDWGSQGDQSLEENYRRFLQTLYGVIVGEFGKTWVHRTWVTNNYEQHSVPEIYQRIFTSALPTANYFSCIKLTLTDQWEYQPINPTFGITPHATVAQIETGRFTTLLPDYALGFIQSGMQYAREHGAAGIFGGTGDTQDPLLESVSYSLWRLSWTPKADLTEVLSDWARQRLGPEGAREVAELLLSLNDIVRDNWYLRPVATRNWAPQQLVNVDMFSVKGNPLWDRGVGQDRFLYDLYLTCKPWLRETMAEVAQGVSRCDEVIHSWDRLRPKLTDTTISDAWAQRFRQVREAMEMMRAYVQAFLLCYAYRDTPTAALHQELARRVADLNTTLERYETTKPYYRPLGIRVFLDIVKRTLADRAALEKYFQDAPTPAAINQLLREAEARDTALAEKYPHAQAFLKWRGTVDGREVFKLQGKSLTLDHWGYNYPHDVHAEVLRSIPTRPLTYFVVRRLGRGWVTLLEAPSPANGWAAKIYLDDYQPSEGVYSFELRGVER